MSRMMRTILAFFAILAALTAWSSDAQPTRKIAPGDVIKVACTEEPLLNKNYTVTADGLMLLEFLGAVQVSGMTLLEAGEKISNKLVTDRILRKATLSMLFVSEPVAQEKQVKIIGAAAVKDPVAWTTGMRVSDVIKLVRPTSDADLTHIVLAKANGTTMLVNFSRYDPSTNANNPEVSPGDELRIPVKNATPAPPTGPVVQPANGGGTTPLPNPGTNNGGTAAPSNPGTQPGPITSGLVMILGGVNKPGAYAMRQNLTVLGAIDLAGGFSQTGDRTKIRLVRRGEAAEKNFDLTKDAGSEALVAGDQITVEASSQKKFVQILGSVRTPGLVEYSDGLTLTQAIAGAGGLNPGTKGEVTIVSIDEGSKARKVSYDDIVRGYRGDVALRSGDTVAIGNVKMTDPSPKPKPAATDSGSKSSKKKKTADAVVIAAAAGILIWLIGK